MYRKIGVCNLCANMKQLMACYSWFSVGFHNRESLIKAQITRLCRWNNNCWSVLCCSMPTKMMLIKKEFSIFQQLANDFEVHPSTISRLWTQVLNTQLTWIFVIYCFLCCYRHYRHCLWVKIKIQLSNIREIVRKMRYAWLSWNNEDPQ